MRRVERLLDPWLAAADRRRQIHAGPSSTRPGPLGLAWTSSPTGAWLSVEQMIAGTADLCLAVADGLELRGRPGLRARIPAAEMLFASRGPV